MIFTTMLLEQENWDPFSSIVTILLLAACLGAPIIRALQERRQRRLNALTQTHAETDPLQDRNLQLWEETLLTASDHNVRLEAIARLGKIGTKDTLDMLSEYAETDRDPEILAAIETALENLEQKQIERRIRGEIEEHPEP